MIMCQVISIPTPLESRGIIDPVTSAEFQLRTFVAITTPLVESNLHSSQGSIMSLVDQLYSRKSEVKSEYYSVINATSEDIFASVSSCVKRCLEVARERGCLLQLIDLPVASHGFALHKEHFGMLFV